MEELQELGKRFQERFGVTPVQIAIHKDEGALAGEVWKPNLHAHIVFDWYDHSTGKSIKTTSLDAIEMQTICAEVLGMGVSGVHVRNHQSRGTKAQASKRELGVGERRMKSWQSVKNRADDRNIEGRAKDLQLRKRTLEEDIGNLSESLHVKAEGIVKGTAQGVAKLVSPESRKGGLRGSTYHWTIPAHATGGRTQANAP